MLTILASGALLIAATTPNPPVFASGSTGPAAPFPDVIETSKPGIAWTRGDLAGRSVAIGNGGTFAWLTEDSPELGISVVSTVAHGPTPEPIYTTEARGARALHIAAARHAPFATVTERRLASGTFRLRLHSAFHESGPSLDLPLAADEPVRGALSDDGVYVAVGYQGATGAIVDVLATSAGVALAPLLSFSFPAGATYLDHALSGDGSTLVVATDVGMRAFDTATGTQLLQFGSAALAADAVAVDADGSTIAVAGTVLHVWREQGGSYTSILSLPGGPVGEPFPACALSRDGDTLVVGTRTLSPPAVGVRLFDLSAPQPTELWNVDLTSTSTDDVVAVELSDSGETVSATLRGAPTGSGRALLFHRDDGEPILDQPLDGESLGASLGACGEFLAVGFLDPSTGTGGAASIRKGGQVFWAEGTASVGAFVDLHIDGEPGDGVLLVTATGLAATPQIVLGFSGALQIDTLLLYQIPLFLTTLTGPPHVEPLEMPGFPALAGLTLYAQTVRLGSDTIDNLVRLPLTK